MTLTCRLLAASLFLLSGACSAQPPFGTSHGAVFKMDTGLGICTAVAVSRHSFATADHCLHPGVVSVELNGRVVEVLGVIADGQDHVLVRTDATFDTWAPKRRTALAPGDEVYVWGTPNGIPDILRRGYFTGTVRLLIPNSETGETEDKLNLLMDVESTGGDSGAPIFDEQGRLVTLVTGGYVLPDGFRLMRAYAMAFTAEQWRAVK